MLETLCTTLIDKHTYSIQYIFLFSHKFKLLFFYELECEVLYVPSAVNLYVVHVNYKLYFIK